jgi:DMSO reductase anchor subunit
MGPTCSVYANAQQTTTSGKSGKSATKSMMVVLSLMAAGGLGAWCVVGKKKRAKFADDLLLKGKETLSMELVSSANGGWTVPTSDSPSPNAVELADSTAFDQFGGLE